jgi:hypothetical protein
LRGCHLEEKKSERDCALESGDGGDSPAEPHGEGQPQLAAAFQVRSRNTAGVTAPPQPLRVHSLVWDGVRFLWTGCEKGALLCDADRAFALHHQTTGLRTEALSMR